MWARARSLWRALRHRSSFERGMDDELRFHLESRTTHFVKQGLSPEDAARRARLEFGNPEAWQDNCRDARGLRLVDDFRQDVRFALRNCQRHPMLAVIVVATLTFGIGISSGVFTLFDAIALRARIDTDPSSFVRVFAASTTDRTRSQPPGNATVEEYAAFRDRARTLRALAAYHRYAVPIGARDDAQPRILLVTCNFFGVYGVERALAGRLLQARDCDAADPVVVLGESLWRSRFSADPGLVGSVVDVNQVPVTVVGIAARSTAEVENAEAWLPYTLRPRLQLGDDPWRRVAGVLPQERWLSLAGRLAEGSDRDAAAAELAVLSAQDDRLHPGRTSRVLVTDGAMIADPGSRTPVVSIMTLVMGALGCLVLIACTNIATLLMSRADARHQEIAIRLSLGAGRSRLMRMLLTEVLLLAICAGLASIYVAYQVPILLTRWLVGSLPAYSLAPDWRVFTYLAALTGLAGIGAGMAPTLEAMRVDVLESLKGRRSILGTAGGARVRMALIGTQLSLSFVLLVGAALFVVTHYRIVTGEPGFDSRRILIPRVMPRDGSSRFPPEAGPAAVADALRSLPGVEIVAFARVAPVHAAPALQISAGGLAARAIAANEVSPGYFEAVGVPIVRGRALEEGDAACARQACHVVVSEALAEEVLAPGEPLGQILRTQAGTSLEVVGVARDTSVQQIGQQDPPSLYLPWNPTTAPYQPIVRFAGSEKSFSLAAADTLRLRFPGMVVDTRTARWYIDAWLDEIGRMELLIVALGASAAALAVIGVFGVVSFAVSRRTREIGVRIALGAGPRDVYAAVLGSGVKPVIAGLACGVVLAVLIATAFARTLARFRFAVSPTDPITYVGVTVLLGVVTLAALAVPARRAAAVNPLNALRSE
jgi:putative ABC transport system permease protein